MKILLVEEKGICKDGVLPVLTAVNNHVEVYIGFLRKKLAAIGSKVKIVSMRRMGYHLEAVEGESGTGE